MSVYKSLHKCKKSEDTAKQGVGRRSRNGITQVLIKRIFQSVKEIFADEESFFVCLDHHFLPCYSEREIVFEEWIFY